jgi:Flp pilus assembly pilin Flp
MLTRVARVARNESGAAMVEFAIVLPLLTLLVFGMIDFGRAFKYYNNLATAARDGARYGAAQSPPTPSQIIARVDAVFRDAAGPTSASLPSVTNYTTVGDPPPPVPPGTQVRVSIVDYPYDALSPFVPTGGLKFTVSATFRREWAP